MNHNIRLARLRGGKEAARLLQLVEAKARFTSTSERIDVFDALAWFDVRVVFKPLKGLLGAYLRGEQPGVLLNTGRPLSVQRFTAAHELGHAVLNHEPSLDSGDVLRRAATNKSARQVLGFASYLQEIEADSFAGEFLIPRWLITYHARKQGWSASALKSPLVAYQMALRCGASYDATIRALERNGFVDSGERDRLLKQTPKSIKTELFHTKDTEDSRADAWSLTLRDNGSHIPLTVGDTATVSLRQEAAAGFVWSQSNQLGDELTLIRTDVNIPDEIVGSSTEKVFQYRAQHAGGTAATFVHGRPWTTEQVASAQFSFSIENPESGLSRANRRRMMHAVG